MRKNTIPTLPSNTDAVIPAASKPASTGAEQLAEPSKQTIANILNFSKALQVEPKTDGQGFIEYITNWSILLVYYCGKLCKFAA